MAAAALVVRRFVSPSPYSCCSIIGSSYSKTPHSYVQLLYFSTSTKSPSASSSSTPLQFTQDFFISKYKLSPQIASKLAYVSAHMRKPQNPDLLLSCLKQCGFSNAHLERIVTHHSKLLSSCPERSVTPKLKIFHDLGFEAAEATELIGRNLTILHTQPERIIRSLDVYRRLLGSNDNVIKLVKKFGCLLYADPEKTILPNIEFLKSCGVQHDQISSRIYSYPVLFLQSPENLRRCVDKVEEMGVERTSKMFIYAASSVCTMSDVSLKIKLKGFQDLGFSQQDILRMFRTRPLVIAVSMRKMKEVKEVLLETGKYDMSSIVQIPESFTRSVEKRYKPRLQVLKELERKGLISKWPSLSTLGAITDKSFFEKFVAPNINEVGEYFHSEDCSEWKTRSGKTSLETKLR